MKVPFPVRSVPALTFRAWLTPPPLPTEVAARDQIGLADLDSSDVGGVPVHHTGEGPLVILAHGWGGRPAQMAPLARSLARGGFKSVVPALPGRAGGHQTDIKQAASALGTVIETLGAPWAVVGHSFAALVLRLTFAEEAPSRIVLVAPALDVEDALGTFGDKLRLLPWARAGLRSRLEAWDPELWPVVSDVSPTQMPGASMLIVHDPRDPETPFARAAQLAALRPETSIVATEGAGHNRILANPDVMEMVEGFLTERSLPATKAG